MERERNDFKSSNSRNNEKDEIEQTSMSRWKIYDHAIGDLKQFFFLFSDKSIKIGII